MKPALALVKNIFQKDNFTFVIQWSDGKENSYRLNQLQSVCPCAACHEKKENPKAEDRENVREDVRAIKIKSVGRYALHIHFTSGCSNGIYGFDLLRSIGEKSHA